MTEALRPNGTNVTLAESSTTPLRRRPVPIARSPAALRYGCPPLPPSAARLAASLNGCSSGRAAPRSTTAVIVSTVFPVSAPTVAPSSSFAARTSPARLAPSPAGQRRVARRRRRLRRHGFNRCRAARRIRVAGIAASASPPASRCAPSRLSSSAWAAARAAPPPPMPAAALPAAPPAAPLFDHRHWAPAAATTPTPTRWRRGRRRQRRRRARARRTRRYCGRRAADAGRRR